MTVRFDLRHLRYFVAVAEELNFGRAAQRLFISQPGLSRQIRELEAILGTQLLVRDTVSVSLTEAGELALLRARKQLADADAFVEEMNQAATRSAKAVRIGVTVALPLATHKALETGWKKALAMDTLALEVGESTALLSRLRRRQLEFALLASTSDFGSFEHEVVHAVPLVAAVAQSHPAARKRTITLADLADTPFFWFPRTYHPGYYDQCAKVFAQAGFKPKYKTVQPGQILTLERIVQGEGCTLLSVSQSESKINGLVYRPLKEGEALGIGVAAVWSGGGADARGRRFAAAARRVLNPPKAKPSKSG